MANSYQSKKQFWEAIMFDGTNVAEIDAWLGPDYKVKEMPQGKMQLRTDADWPRPVIVEAGPWVVRNVEGRLVSILSDEDFNHLYEPYLPTP